jgi:hypothetical protein
LIAILFVVHALRGARTDIRDVLFELITTARRRAATAMALGHVREAVREATDGAEREDQDERCTFDGMHDVLRLLRFSSW